MKIKNIPHYAEKIRAVYLYDRSTRDGEKSTIHQEAKTFFEEIKIPGIENIFVTT